jgi:LPS-assembly protein
MNAPDRRRILAGILAAAIGAPAIAETPTDAVSPAISAETLPPSELRNEQTILSPSPPGIPQFEQLPDWVVPLEALPLDNDAAAAGSSRSETAAEKRVRREQRLHEGLDWAFCGPRATGTDATQTPPPVPPETPIDIEAGAVTYQQDTGILTLSGGVDVRRDDERVTADLVRYDRNTGDLATEGETLLNRPGVRLIGDQALLNLETHQGRMDNVSYRFSESANLRGRADYAELLDRSRTRYGNLVYSTCPPGSNAWSMKASKLRLDQEKGIGVARDARLRIKGVPVLYTPYLRFPIDDRRKSGFLIPTVGTSDESGFELSVPYYWNIAPNLDATISPRYLSERGLLLGTELRYLTRNDRGRIEAEVIPDDAKYEGNGARWALDLAEDGVWFDRFITRLEFSAVSDDTYLEDFGNGLDITSTRRLLRAVNYDYFDHNHIVHGQRFTLTPVLSLPLQRSWGHLIPGARLYLIEL